MAGALQANGLLELSPGVANNPTPTPSSSPAPTTNTDSGYYSRLPSGATEDQVTAANANKYATQTPEDASEAYRAEALKTAQDRITSINNTYGEKLQDELNLQKPVNENNLGRTNALSSLMGLSGSSSADTRSSVQESRNAETNKGISDKVNSQKMAALDAIYGKIDEGAQKVYEAQLATNKEKQKTLLDDVAKNATANLTAIASHLAGTGKTFDDFKAADGGLALKSLMDQTGQTEYQLRNSFNNAIPENLRPTVHTSYIDDGKGGTIMRQVSFDPVSKKAESQDYPLNVPASTFNGDAKPIEGKNGELFVKQADGSYKDVSPNADNNKLLADAAVTKAQGEGTKFVAATKTQPAGFVIGGKFTPLAPSGKIAGGTGGASNLTIGSGTGIIAGVKVPTAIAGDVEDILSGRNTLFNIKQTMGRSNQAAAQMKQLRDAIRSVDPKFDFVASDAGGKAVSSQYYQKGIAAIKTVLPNLDKVVDLSNQVSRIGVAGVDKLLQTGNIQIGDKKVANFHEAQKLLSDEIGLALGGGAVSDMKLQLGFDATDPSMSKEVFASNIGLVKEFIQNRQKALESVRYSSDTAESTEAPTSAGNTTVMTGPDGKQFNVPPDKVDLFKQNGYK